MANDDRLVSQKEKKTITFILACEKSGESRGQEIEIANRDDTTLWKNFFERSSKHVLIFPTCFSQ